MELQQQIEELTAQDYELEVAQLLHHNMSMPLILKQPLERRLKIMAIATALVMLDEVQDAGQLGALALMQGSAINDHAQVMAAQLREGHQNG